MTLYGSMRAGAGAAKLLVGVAVGLLAGLWLGGSAPGLVQVGNYILPTESGQMKDTDSYLPKACDVAIIGGGAGGMYSAYRLLSGLDHPPSVCVFEATNRIGGRIFSLRGLGGRGDLTVDIGAYRYVDGRHTLVQGVVENLLELPYTLYDPASPLFRKIVDDNGDDAGFVTFVEGLARKAVGLGAKLFLNTAATKVDRLPGTQGAPQYAITFFTAKGKVAKVLASRVIMNTPQRPLMRILQNSNLARTTEWSTALDMPFPYMAAKMYLYYDDAWWVYMNRTTGSFSDPYTANATTYNSSTLFTSPPMRARYHDGDWRCDADGSCHGFLLYTYMSDNFGSYNRGGQGLDINPYSGVVPRYYWNIAVNPDMSKPYVVLDSSSNSGRQLMKAAHKKVVDYHISINKPIPEPYASTSPSQVLVVVWDPSVFWTGGAWHGYKNGALGGVVNTSAGADPAQSVPVAALKPWAAEEIYLANECFAVGSLQGWAEGSLMLAENIVSRFMGAARPTFLPADRHDCVLFPTFNHNATLCSLSLNPLVQGVTRRRASAATGRMGGVDGVAGAGGAGGVGGDGVAASEL